MINGKSVLGIIPARGGSKGISRKNIKLLAGKPLIAWTIEEAKKSRFIDRTIVSTDSQEIICVSIKYGAETPFVRPSELAKDGTPTSDVIIHAIEWLTVNQNHKSDILILLQPTSPFRRYDQIDSAIESFSNSTNSKCLVSVKEVEENPYWMKMLDDDGYLKNFIVQQNSFNRRQDLPKIHILNGAIYIMRTLDFLNNKSFETDNTIPFFMDKKTSIDIDTDYDFKLAEVLAKEE